MAGQMGNERVTVLNLEVVEADPERNLLLLIRGAVPGPDGGLVMVRTAVKAGATKKEASDGDRRRPGRRRARWSASASFPAELFEAHRQRAADAPGGAGRRSPPSAPGTHSTKTRGDVAGGGKKPWRQKGTGRARQGSIRSPQWSGGGVAHGPHPRGHEMRVNKKMKQGALRSALTDALPVGQARRRRGRSRSTAPKTKDAVGVLGALRLEGKVLIVLPARRNGAVEKSFRNLRERPDRRTRGTSSTYDLHRAPTGCCSRKPRSAALTGEEPRRRETVVELPALEPAHTEAGTGGSDTEPEATATGASEPEAPSSRRGRSRRRPPPDGEKDGDEDGGGA